jgi:DNA-binding transcriptional LysR family regulator
LTRLRFIAVAHPDHPLHKLGRMLTTRDLRGQRHLVVRDSGPKRASRTTGVQADQRRTVSHMSTSIQAASMGYGFAWLPEEKIRAELAAGVLKPLPLREGQERVGDLYLNIRQP